MTTTLTEKQKQLITDGGIANLSAKDLAILTDLPKKEVERALYDPESEIYLLYKKGKIGKMVEICVKLSEKALSGNRLAAKALLTLRTEIQFRAGLDNFLGIP